MKIIGLCLIIMAALFTGKLTAKEIYISTKGSNLNPGTKELPLATLQGARDLMRQQRSAGIAKSDYRVIVEEGTYLMTEPLVLTGEDSGSPDTPILFTAAEGAKPVFKGGMPITNWVKVSDKLWQCHIPEVKRYGLYFEQLYVNEKFATRAKSPNRGFYFLKGVKETTIHQGKGRTVDLATQKLSLFPPAMADLRKITGSDSDDVILQFYHKWDNTRKRILGMDADSSVVFTVGKGMKQWNMLDKQTRFSIENVKAALDTCGEWYLDRTGEIFYVPKPGETPENTSIYAPLTDRFVQLVGSPEKGRQVEFIRFENLRFEASGYKMPMGGEEAAQAASPIEAVIMADYVHHIAFVNCEISQIGTNAIWFRKACTDCLVSHCYLHDLGAGGVKIGEIVQPTNDADLTKRIVIDNNIIRGGGFVFPCAVGVIIFQSSDNQVLHNEIANFRYTGISVGWVWGYSYSPSKRNKIEFNHIHHLGWGELCDMGGVYCLGEAEGTTVSNNVIHHIYSFDYGGWGLYTDEGSTGVVMENNLVYACKNSGFHQHYGKENTIRNNVFAANIKAQLQATRVEQHLSFNFTNNIVWYNSGNLLSNNWDKVDIHSDHNCYWDVRTRDIRFGKYSFKEWQKSGKDLHSVMADPGFVNPLAFNFAPTNRNVLKNIGFKPFDPAKAGVYGTQEWKNLAAFDSELAKSYDEAVSSVEKYWDQK